MPDPNKSIGELFEDGKAMDAAMRRAVRAATGSTPPPRKKSRIVEAFSPRRLVLFGSRARGTARSDRDVDFLVKMETDLPFYERIRAILRILAAVRHLLTGT